MDINPLKAKEMKNTLKQLKATLPADKFVVTGSFVLAEYGLTNYSQVKDLDIILVNPKPSVMEILENLMKVSPAPTTKQFLEIRDKNNPPTPAKHIEEDDEEYDTPKRNFSDCVKKAQREPSSLKPVAIFTYNNHKVDIYIENHFSEPTLSIDSIDYTTVKRVVSAKKTIGRMKDWLQLRDFARIFFKQEEFDTILNRTDNWKQALREEY